MCSSLRVLILWCLLFIHRKSLFFAGLSWEGNDLKFAILKGSHINKRSWRRLYFSFAEWFDDFWRSFSANSWMMIFWMCKLDFISKTHYHAFSRYLHDGKIQFKFTNIIGCNSSSRNATLRTFPKLPTFGTSITPVIISREHLDLHRFWFNNSAKVGRGSLKQNSIVT